MIFDVLISEVTEVITDGIDTIKDVTSDVRKEVNDTKDAMVQSFKDILNTIKED